MRPALFACFFAVVSSSAAAAQEAPSKDQSAPKEALPSNVFKSDRAHPAGQSSSSKASPPESTTLSDEGDESPAAQTAEESLSIGDARMNFVTVLETFMTVNSPNGYWLFEDASTGKPLKLKLQSIDKFSVAKGDGDSIYVGTALMRQASGPGTVPIRFTVDLSGEEWKVQKFARAQTEEAQVPDEEAGSEDPASPADAVAAAIKSYVQKASKKTGTFPLADAALKKRWRLKLRKIHTERLVTLEDGRIIACADFKEFNGKKSLDLDFFARQEAGAWTIEKVLLHKAAGKPRLTYDENHEILKPEPKK